MNDSCDFFEQAAGRGSTKNMDMNSLSAMVNVTIFVTRKIVDVLAEQGVPQEVLGKCEDANSESLVTLIERHRKNVDHLFTTAGLDYLVGKRIDSWKVEQDTACFALFDGVPHPEGKAVCITLLPCNESITCFPESKPMLERFLLAAAFEAHVYGLARDLVNQHTLRGVQFDVGDRVLSLREWLSEYQRDLLEEVQRFLLTVPDVNAD